MPIERMSSYIKVGIRMRMGISQSHYIQKRQLVWVCVGVGMMGWKGINHFSFLVWKYFTLDASSGYSFMYFFISISYSCLPLLASSW